MIRPRKLLARAMATLTCLFALAPLARALDIKTGNPSNIKVLVPLNQTNSSNYLSGQAANITVTIYKNGATTGVAGTGTVTELGTTGVYWYLPSASDTANFGDLDIVFHCTGADDSHRFVTVVGNDPTSSTDGGLSSVTTAATQATTAATQATAAATSASSNTTSLNTLLGALTPFTSSVNDTSSTTTVVDSALTSTADISGDTIIFTSGALKGVARHIASINTTNGQITVNTALASAPANGVTFAILPGSKAITQFLAALGADNKPLISSSYTFPSMSLQASDETLFSNMTAMITGTGASAKFTASALSNAPTGSGGSGDPWQTTLASEGTAGTFGAFVKSLPSVVQIAAAILANPNNLLVTDTSGHVYLAGTEYQEISASVQDAICNPLYSGLTVQSGSPYSTAQNTNGIANKIGFSGTGPYTVNSSLSSSDETLMGNLTAMITGSGASAKYTTGALSNAPGGSGSDPFGLTRTPANYAAGTWGNWLDTQLANPVPSDYQQRGVAVTLPATVLGSGDLAAVANAVLSAVVDGTLNVKQLLAIQNAMTFEAARTWNATTHTAVSTWYRRLAGGTGADTSRPLVTKTTVYDSTNTQVVSSSITFTNLP